MALHEVTKPANQGAGLSTDQDTYIKNVVDANHPIYESWLKHSRLTRALMGGTAAMQKAGETFLPRFPLEKPEFYQTRLSNSILKNAFRKTVQFLAGQVFQTEITFNDDFPVAVAGYMDDIDKLGTSLAVFSKRLFEVGIATGVSHILIEAPVATGAKTTAEEKAAGVRPYFKELKGDQVFAWRLDAAGVLSQIRYREVVTEPDGEFGEVAIEQIKVLEVGTWRAYRRKDKGDFVLYDQGRTSLSVIPLITFLPGDPFSMLTGESPLQDLADLQLQHWRSSSDQTNILHVARVPILFGKGITDANFNLGSQKAVISEDENASLQWVEHSGKAIEAGAADLVAIESAMALYGLQQLIPRTGSITATEKALSSAESNSSLGSWVQAFEDTLFKALQIFGQYMTAPVVEGSVKMPSSFMHGIVDTATLTLLIDAVDRNILSKEAVFAAINRTDILPDGLTWEDVRDQITLEATNNTIFGTGAGAGAFL